MGPNAKAWAGGLAVAVMTIAAWALKQYAATELPDEVQGAATTLITMAVVYFVPNQPA